MSECAMMDAWRVARPGPVASRPLRLERMPVPVPGPGEVLIRVLACGVCRSDLHVAEGDLAPRRTGVVPGHEVVGEVVQGAGFEPGRRIGVAWLRGTCGECRYCRRGQENLCPESTYTGWDADGGYAQYLAVPAAYTYDLPEGYTDEELAPLLCAGISGYRALRSADLPAGGRLGIYGFGASAHLAAQIAVAEGARLHVFTRSAAAQKLALQLGAVSAGGPQDPPAEKLDSAITFAPSGALVPLALEALDHGGTLVTAGIHLSEIPPLSYERHLFHERRLRSVRSNTRADGREFLELAGRRKLEVTTTRYRLDQAATALHDLASGLIEGAGVLVP